MRGWPTWLMLCGVAGCAPPPTPRYAEPPVFVGDGGDPAIAIVPVTTEPVLPAEPAALPSKRTPVEIVSRSTEFAFDGGSIELQLVRDGDRVVQWAINHYAVPVVIHWDSTKLVNLRGITPIEGVVVLPAAPTPSGDSTPITLGELAIRDPHAAFHRTIALTARFGDPRARPRLYPYRLPYPSRRAFGVLQGFHGAFSHRGSDEYAVDFDCPVATPVLAARDGIVVATHASAQGAGTTREYLSYARANFVLVLHDDGTLGEYMHLAPAGVEVIPGQQVVRGQELALSGNTGYSSTPHLHFQVMTAGTDGVGAHSFPFEFALGPDDVEQPVEGQRYPAWE